MAEESLNTQDENLENNDPSLGTTSQNPMLDDPYSIAEFNRPGTTNIENFMPITGGSPKVDLGSGLTSNLNKVRDSVTGFPPYSPNQLPANPKQRLEARLDILGKDIQGSVDRNAYSKPYMYDGTSSGAHRARYLGYGQEDFDKIGFNPLVNNEEVFNANTTIADDFVRMTTHSFLPMFGLGFIAGPKSYVQAGGGNFGQDVQLADEYEEYNAIGMSTKGGVGGFVNNIFNSVAYSAGVLTEAVLENALIGAVEGAIVGGPGGAAAGAAGGGLFGLLKSIPKMGKSLFQMAKYGGKMNSQLKNLRKYSAARQMWKEAGKNTMNYINPLGQTTKALQRNVFSNADNLGNLARSARTAGGFFRDVNMLNAALSEGRLEGGFVENQTYTKNYDEFWKREGRAPTSEEQLDMRKRAKTAGFRAAMKNTALINYTNKLAFPNLFKGSLLKGSYNVGKVNNMFSVAYKAPTEAGKRGAYELVDYNLKNALKGLVQPKTLGRASVNYFKLNVIEGAQEVLQDVIAQSTEEYYVETFFDKSKENTEYSMATLGSAFGNQFGEQGFETFMSGFFMGALLRPVNSAPMFIEKKLAQYTKDGGAQQYYDERKVHGEKVVNSMNRLNDPLELLNNRMMNYASQAIIAKDNNRNNINTKEAKDNVTTSLVSDVQTVLDAGMYDVWLSNFKEYDQMDAQGFEEAAELEKGQGEEGKKQLKNFLKRAERIKKTYDYGKQNIANTKVNLQNLKKGTPEYDKAAIYNSAIDRSMWNLVFFQESFEDNLTRVNKLYTKLDGLNIFSALPGAQFQNIADLKKLDTEVQMLNQEISVLQESQSANATVSQESQIQSKIELRDALVNFQAAQREWTVETRELLQNAFKKQKESGSEANINEAIEEVLKTYEDNYDPNINYKQSFQDLLKALAGDNMAFQDMLNKQGLDSFDELYADLLDVHALQRESQNLVPFINLLLDPNGFAQHVDRNFSWMRNLWLTREEYYKKAVNDSIEMKEYNDLLWSLSQENIYIDLKEFGKWVEDKDNYVPEEFIDVSEGQERIIPKGSMLFDKYYEQFRQVAQMQKVKAAGEESDLTGQRDKAVADLLEQKENDLQAAQESFEADVKVETGSTVAEIEEASNVPEVDATKIRMQRARVQALEKEKEKLEEILDNVSAQNILELDAALKQIVKTKLLGFGNAEFVTEYEAVLRPNFEDKLDQDAELNSKVEASTYKAAEGFSDFNLAASTVMDAYAFTDLIDQEVAEINEYIEKQEGLQDVPRTTIEDTQSYKDYQKVLDEINSKYEGLIEEVNINFRDRGLSLDDVEQAIKTSDKYETLPDDLKAQLQPLFDKRLNDPTLKDENVEEYERRRQAWFETQGKLVNEYNDKKNTERIAAEKEAVTIKAPTLKFKSISNILDKTMPEIQGLIDTYKTYLETGVKPKGRLKSEALTKKDKQDLNADVKALEVLLDKKRRTFESYSEYTETINLFKSRVLDRASEVEEVTDDAGNLKRLIKGKEAERVTSIADKLDQDINSKDPFRFKSKDMDAVILPLVDVALEDGVKDSVKQFVTSFRNLKYSEFTNTAKYTILEERLRADGLTKENVENILNDIAYMEASEGGNAVDVTAKDFFTINPKGGFMVPTKPDNMSQTAFDQLYGKDGILTKFRDRIIDGEFQIVGASNLVFDADLGIAGETDLIAINPEGEFMIIDLKSLGVSGWRNFNTSRDKILLQDELRKQGLSDEEIAENPEMLKLNDKFSQRNKFTYQQSLYRNLFYRMTGKTPKMALLPVQLKYNRQTGEIIEASRPTGVLANEEDLIMLDYDKAVEEFVPLKAPTFNIEPGGKETFEEPVPSDEFLLIDEYAKSNKLEDNLNKIVVYNGQIGTLVKTPEGSYGVQFSGSTGTTILDVYDKGEPVTDGNTTFNTVAIDKVMNIENLGEVSTIEGAQVTAAFSNESETRAVINGVSYEVNRDDVGKIVSLSYNTNDREINLLDGDLGALSEVMDAFAEVRKKAKTTDEKNAATNRIADAQLEFNQVLSKQNELKRTNSRRTARGGNANAMIFALNRLPSEFASKKETRTQEEALEDIKRLATVSDAVFDGVTAIMMNQYPAKLDQLIDNGPSGLNSKDYLAIKLWSEEVLSQLEQLESQVINRGDLATYVTGVKNQIIELQNNIELIKLTKDGKTVSTKQPEARKVFGSKAEVPFRFDISNVQGTDTGSTEGVPGSKKPSNKEASEIIDTVLERPKKEKAEKGSTKAQDVLIEKIQGLNKNNFDKESANALIQARNNKNINEAEVIRAVQQKQEELDTIIEDLLIDDNVISKTPIFESQDPVVMRVTKVFKNGNVNLEDINNSKNKLKLTMSELTDQFNIVSENSPAFKEKVIEVASDEGNLEESKATVAELTQEEINNALDDDTSEDDDLDFLKNRPCKN